MMCKNNIVYKISQDKKIKRENKKFPAEILKNKEESEEIRYKIRKEKR